MLYHLPVQLEKLDSTLLMLPGSCGFRSWSAASCDAPSFWIPLGFRFHNVYHHHCIVTFKRQSQQTPHFFSAGIHKVILLHAKSLQSCLTLCDPMDHSPPGPTVHGFPRQEYCSGLPCPPPRDLPHPGIEPMSLTSPALAGKFFPISTTRKAHGDIT